MLNRTRPIFSSRDNKIFLDIPERYAELTQRQLRYVLFLLLNYPPIKVKTFFIMRVGGITVQKRVHDGWLCSIRERWWKPRKWFTVRTESIVDITHKCDWIDDYERLNTRLVTVNGFRAVDTDLHGVSFEDYLNLEGLYQMFLQKRDDGLLLKMAQYLYRDRKGNKALKIKCNEVEKFGCFVWWIYVKSYFAKCFPNFFRKAEAADGEEYDVMAAVNAQIRALTDGDITKEREVLSKECWRALTELDAKARESEEYKRKYGK